ncbi:MAG: hypothetical protein WC470_00805 [Candidatus Paceibacterota bacterium]
MYYCYAGDLDEEGGAATGGEPGLRKISVEIYPKANPIHWAWTWMRTN